MDSQGLVQQLTATFENSSTLKSALDDCGFEGFLTALGAPSLNNQLVNEFNQILQSNDQSLNNLMTSLDSLSVNNDELAHGVNIMRMMIKNRDGVMAKEL